MANKKPATYNPDAIDADGDGMVQEGTEFERPVGTDLEITISEVTEAPVAVETPAAPATTPAGVYVAVDGDSYATIAELFPVAGVGKHARATQLWRDHGGRALKAGVEVTL